jgi:hypothetical protein
MNMLIHEAGHVDEDDPVALALLEIGRRHQHAEIEPGQAENGRDCPKRDQGAGQRVEGGGEAKR